MRQALNNDIDGMRQALKSIFSSPVRKYRKNYCTNLGVGGGGINKMLVLRQSF